MRLASRDISIQEAIRPTLDAIDSLRSLGIAEDGIHLPTIVVVGDQSSGKSSVLESLAGVSLPKGDGVVTRVPLVLRMQSCQSEEEEEITLSYKLHSMGMGQVPVKKQIRKDQIEKSVLEATNVLAGHYKGIVNKPITLNISGVGLPDLTLVDLPGITRKPVGEQPKNIYQLIESMIREYITPEETVILNVLPADADFSLSQSLVLSEEVDNAGERTLAVVTKVDRKPEGLKEKVEKNDVKIGLGYVLVRNRIAKDKSFEAARALEEEFFRTHPELCKMDKKKTGVPALARILSEIQAKRLSKCLPDIKAKVAMKLREQQAELASIPPLVDTSAQAVMEICRVLKERSIMMNDIMQGVYSQFAGCKEMHFATKVHGIVEAFFKELRNNANMLLEEQFHEKCAEVLRSASGVSLPNILGHESVKQVVCSLVDGIAPLCYKFVEDAFAYAADVMETVTATVCASYPDFEACLLDVGHTALEEGQVNTEHFTERFLRRESHANFTLSANYMKSINDLTTAIDAASKDRRAPRVVNIAAEKEVNVSYLIYVKDQPATELQTKLFCYWLVVVVGRLADVLAMEVRLSLRESLLDVTESAAAVRVHGLDPLSLVQTPLPQRQRRKELEGSITRLKDSKEILARLVPGASGTFNKVASPGKGSGVGKTIEM